MKNISWIYEIIPNLDSINILHNVSTLLELVVKSVHVDGPEPHIEFQNLFSHRFQDMGKSFHTVTIATWKNREVGETTVKCSIRRGSWVMFKKGKTAMFFFPHQAQNLSWQFPSSLHAAIYFHHDKCIHFSQLLTLSALLRLLGKYLKRTLK